MTWFVKIEVGGAERYLCAGQAVAIEFATRFMSQSNALFLARQFEREKASSGRAVTCEVIKAGF